MPILVQILVALIALLHVYILWFEAFAWEQRGPRIFTHFDRDLFAKTKAMAANQGLYNGFLAAGLVWSLLISEPLWAGRIALFFLICVAVAGVVGAVTASRRIFAVQTVPALLAIALLLAL